MKIKYVGFLIGSVLISSITLAEDKTSSIQDSPVNHIENKIDNILNKKVYLKVESPEQYIANLDTTDFVKGLFLESVVLSQKIAENKDNDLKLESMAQDVINNTACQQAIMGEESLFHYQKLMNLLFTKPDERQNFLVGQQNIEKFVKNVTIDKDFLDYCKQQTY